MNGEKLKLKFKKIKRIEIIQINYISDTSKNQIIQETMVTLQKIQEIWTLAKK